MASAFFSSIVLVGTLPTWTTKPVQDKSDCVMLPKQQYSQEIKEQKQRGVKRMFWLTFCLPRIETSSGKNPFGQKRGGLFWDGLIWGGSSYRA